MVNSIPFCQLKLLPGATKFWHCNKKLKGVAGQVNFGHHVNESVPCIAHDFSHVILCEIATNGDAVPSCALAQIALFIEDRIGLAFHSISLIVAEVQVESVHLDQSQDVNQTLDNVLVKKVTDNVQHKTAMFKAGLILYDTVVKVSHALVIAVKNQLLQGHGAMKQTFVCG